MNKIVKAYLYEQGTVVTDKSMIRNARDNDFEEVSLVLSEKFA